MIDDEPGIREMIRTHFQCRGFEVLTAADGSEGIAFCEKDPPDIILLDFKMKKMDGDLALPELRRLAPKSILFLVSAYPQEIIRSKIDGLQISAYFEKPVPILELERAIRSALEKRESL